MHIVLINPPFGLDQLLGRTSSMKSVINVTQPLGIAYIASVLESKGMDVKIYDCQCENIDLKNLTQKLEKDSPDMVGITASTPAFGSAIEVAKSVRENLPNARIVIGGPHVTALPESTLNLDCFDVGVVGEGEITMQELTKCIDSKSLKMVKGIAFRSNRKIFRTEARPFIKNLDQISFPARHLLPPLKKYTPTPASYVKLPQAQVMTSRGCPRNCTFCDTSAFGVSYRCRSVENVFDEIEELINNYGMKDLKFFDDTFTVIPNRVYEICDEFKKRHIDIPWCCLTRTNMVTKRLLIRMKKAGCWQILFGLESMNQNILTDLRKGTTVEQNIKAVKWAHEAGLSVRADFLFGTPNDSIEGMIKTLKGAMRLNMDFAHFNKFTPYPGSQLYKDLLKQGFEFDVENYPSQLDHESFIYVPHYLSEDQFKILLNAAYKRYYLRSEYMLKQLLKVRNLETLKRLIKGFWAIAGLKN